MSAPRLPWETADSQADFGSEAELEELDSQTASEALQDPSDRSATVRDVQEMISRAELQPAMDAVQNAVETTLRARSAGQGVDISTTTVSGQKIKLNDAKQRAFRTLLQNLSIDLLVAFGTVLPMLLDMDWTDGKAWGLFGFSIGKTIISVFISYVSRLAVDPVIPTPVEQPNGEVIQPLVQRQTSDPRRMRGGVGA